MAKVYKVASPTLALKLANKFKQQGIYDLFRGQNEDWPLVASIKRLSIKNKKMRLIDYGDSNFFFQNIRSLRNMGTT